MKRGTRHGKGGEQVVCNRLWESDGVCRGRSRGCRCGQTKPERRLARFVFDGRRDQPGQRSDWNVTESALRGTIAQDSQ
jgi:hypothetical protein